MDRLVEFRKCVRNWNRDCILSKLSATNTWIYNQNAHPARKCMIPTSDRWKGDEEWSRNSGWLGWRHFYNFAHLLANPIYFRWVAINLLLKTFCRDGILLESGRSHQHRSCRIMYYISWSTLHMYRGGRIHNWTWKFGMILAWSNEYDYSNIHAELKMPSNTMS